MIEIATNAEGISFAVRVQPKAGRQGIIGQHNGALKIAVTAAPEGGRANKALLEVLAKSLGVAKWAILIVSGEAARDKRVRVLCPAANDLAARVQQLGASRS